MKLKPGYRYWSEDEKVDPIFNSKKTHRYRLSVSWDASKDTVTFIMLNPSAADEKVCDSTISRCIQFAKSWGYGGIHAVNLFSLISTDPDELYSNDDPIGELNDAYIEETVKTSSLLVYAWGEKHCTSGDRDMQVKHMLKDYNPYCIKMTIDGKHPRHPLYLEKGLKPKPFKYTQEVNSINTSFMSLTNQQLNRVARDMVMSNFKKYNAQVLEKDKRLVVKTDHSKGIEVLVKSIRRPTEYVLIQKKNMNAEQPNLFLSLVIFTEEQEPELFLVPAKAFLHPNDLLRDRPHYEEPEFGMNVSKKNMPLLNRYKFDTSIRNIGD